MSIYKMYSLSISKSSRTEKNMPLLNQSCTALRLNKRDRTPAAKVRGLQCCQFGTNGAALAPFAVVGCC
jgi:hypothetical protein